MNQVWIFFKFLELLIGLSCILNHVRGAMYIQEPLPHNLIFCATFICYVLLCLVGMLRIIIKMRTLIFREFFITLSGSITHYICGFLTMYYAEEDFHLMYMGQEQELEHKFFASCKKQSIASMVAGTMYLLHAMLVLEIIMKTPHNVELTGAESPIHIVRITRGGYEYRDYMAKTSADIYFLSKTVDQYLRKRFTWFRDLAGSQEMNRDQGPPSRRREIQHIDPGLSLNVHPTPDEEVGESDSLESDIIMSESAFEDESFELDDISHSIHLKIDDRSSTSSPTSGRSLALSVSSTYKNKNVRW